MNVPVFRAGTAAQTGTVFPRRNRFRFPEFNRSPATSSAKMAMDYNHQAEARAAMEMAATATSEPERQTWVRVALAWQDLARGHEGKISRLLPPITATT
jgi:hypothetical protein